MKCFFINLEASRERREALVDNFTRFTPSDWSLERFAAVDAAGVQARKIIGSLRPSAIACGLSHLELMREKRNETSPFLMLEDDALFGPNSCTMIREAIDLLEREGPWDILFPDLCITQMGVMADLLALRRKLMQEGGMRLLNPMRWAFASSTSYILHPRAIPKILSAEPKEWNVPYDLLLRHLVQEGRLRARCIFPFALSLEENSNASTISSDAELRTVYIWYLFRRMIWRDGHFAHHIAETENLAQGLSAETLAYARLWAAMADPSFVPK